MLCEVLHRDFNKIKQRGRVVVLDEKAAEKLYNRLRLIESDGDTYKVAFNTATGVLKDDLSPRNRWLAPDTYLRIFGKRFMKDMSFDVNKAEQKVRFQRRRKNE